MCVAGSYRWTVDTTTLPAGLAANPTYDEDGIGTTHTTAVTVTSGEELTDGGLRLQLGGRRRDVTGNTGTGAIGDRVWIDADGDGVQDPGEAGLGGVTRRAVHDPDGDGVVDTGDDVVGDDDDRRGRQLHLRRAGGRAPTWCVVNGGTTPAGYTQTGDPDGDAGQLRRPTQPIVLAPGDVYVNADFGYEPRRAAAAAIGDTIWLDANGDGT